MKSVYGKKMKLIYTKRELEKDFKGIIIWMRDSDQYCIDNIGLAVKDDGIIDRTYAIDYLNDYYNYIYDEKIPVEDRDEDLPKVLSSSLTTDFFDKFYQIVPLIDYLRMGTNEDGEDLVVLINFVEEIF